MRQNRTTRQRNNQSPTYQLDRNREAGQNSNPPTNRTLLNSQANNSNSDPLRYHLQIASANREVQDIDNGGESEVDLNLDQLREL